jgi:hypothetical protein
MVELLTCARGIVAGRVSGRRSGSDVAPAQIESLERRAMLSVTIDGAVMRDMTGNGLTADDQPLSGVVVKLYRDVNANGKLDSTDGASLASRTSASGTGAFSFTGLSTGRYLVTETPGANQVRTGPVFSNTIAINATNADGTYANNLFANYVKNFDRSAVGSISYLINGTKTVTTLAGNVKQGDTVQVSFTVAAGKTFQLSLVSYKATGLTGGDLTKQTVYDSATGTFSAGRHSMTIDVPCCYFQVDFVGGPVIDKFGPNGSNIFYTAQGRLIAAATGGTTACPCTCEKTGDEGLTPGFWKNHTNVWGPTGYLPTQTLESVFDVPDSLGMDNFTLLEALNFKGGSGVAGAARNLFRHAVAAVLNAAHPLVDYTITSASIITQVNVALASGNKTATETLKDTLDSYNNKGGGIDAHGNPV